MEVFGPVKNFGPVDLTGLNHADRRVCPIIQDARGPGGCSKFDKVEPRSSLVGPDNVGAVHAKGLSPPPDHISKTIFRKLRDPCTLHSKPGYAYRYVQFGPT